MSEIYDKALAKLDKENKSFKGGSHASVMRKDVVEVLKSFCSQEDEFAQAIFETDKTLSDCLEYVAKGVKGSSIRDLDAFKRAAEFYFKGADISCVMHIDLVGSARQSSPDIIMTSAVQTSESDKPKSAALSLSLDDLF